MTENFGQLVDIKIDLESRGECSCWVLRQLRRDEKCIHCLDKLKADTDSDAQNDFLESHAIEVRR